MLNHAFKCDNRGHLKNKHVKAFIVYDFQGIYAFYVSFMA